MTFWVLVSAEHRGREEFKVSSQIKMSAYVCGAGVLTSVDLFQGLLSLALILPQCIDGTIMICPRVCDLPDYYVSSAVVRGWSSIFY